MSLKDKLPGKFIVLDGPDGSGKSVQLGLLSAELQLQGLPIICTRDPGGTPIGDRIRELLLSKQLDEMDLRCETLLFMASRAQLVGEIIDPALQNNQAVLCDRFISATCAYQGAAGYNIRRIIEMGDFAVGHTWPHLTLVIDVPVEEGFQRIEKPDNDRQGNRDAMESRPLDYHRRVRDLFRNLPDEYPGRVEIVDGLGNPQEVHQRIMEILERVDF